MIGFEDGDVIKVRCAEQALLVEIGGCLFLATFALIMSIM